MKGDFYRPFGRRGFSYLSVQGAREGKDVYLSLFMNYGENYGIHFDTGKADFKPEPLPALREIAGFLKANPAGTYYLVGHTDNVGGFNANMALSENRSKAVHRYSTDQGKAANRQHDIEPASGHGLMKSS